MPIRILDAATVGRIAAGEVVERPSSVVKELIENSLDAGATSITVEIKGGGIDYLRVTDNGCGIEPGQVRLAFENHATSKLQRPEQLDDIRTLGFRGEALPSIAAVSRVEMTTRARGQESGAKLTIDGGQNMQVKEAGCPQGTTIIMRDLFFNVPVRRAFLKKSNYEGGLVSDAVAKLLLGNPGVSMRFISGGNTLFHSFGDGKLRHAVFSVYGRETAEKMVELDASEGGVRIFGMIGVGELAKATRSHQLFYINGRSVRCPLLSRTLEQVCRSRVTIGMYPMCVLNLVIPSTGVDVNVHPNKLEVRFRDAEMMRAACEKLLAQAFEGERVLEIEKLTSPKQRVERKTEIREIPLEKIPLDGAAAEKPVENASPKPAEPVQEKPSSRLDQAQPVHKPDGETTSETKSEPVPETKPETAAEPKPHTRPYMWNLADLRAEQQRMNLEKYRGPMDNMVTEEQNFRSSNHMLKVIHKNVDAETGKTEYRTITVDDRITPSSAHLTAEVEAAKRAEKKRAEEARAAAAREAEAASRPEPEKESLPFRVIGVLFKTYILVETGETLLLIDQHAAHERLQYEKLMARAQAGTASQQLLTPIVLRLSSREMAIIMDNIKTLEEAGYTVEPFGEKDIRVTAVPFVLGRAEIKPIFLDLIHSLSQLKTATIDARRSEIIQMACKSAVKAGDQLSDSEIAALIKGMLETGAPPTCPHGRPVVKTLTRRDLEKMFKRIQ